MAVRYEESGLSVHIVSRQFHRQDVSAAFNRVHAYRHPLPFDAYRTVKRGICRDKHAAHLQRFQQPELQSCPGGHCLVFGHAGTYRIGSGKLSAAHGSGKTVIAGYRVGYRRYGQ